MNSIIIQGARTHNLQNIDVVIPRDQLTVITGLSGSGKSSLAFDTLYAEGQRRYVESLSAYARQFLSMMEKPDVDSIEGLSPAISIEQKTTSHNPRSTVGTVTELYDYLRLLFARVGEPHCPKHHVSLHAKTITQMVDEVLKLPHDSKAMILAPIVRDRKGEHVQLLKQLSIQGFVRARINGQIYDLDAPPTLALHEKHSIDVVIDRFKIHPDRQQRLSESFETAVRLAEGIVIVAPLEGQFTEQLWSANYACPMCGFNLQELEPRLFSFNNPAGACGACDGLGVDYFMDPQKIVHHPHLSIAQGAIRGWDKKTPYYYPLFESLAQHYHFDLDTPFAELPSPLQNLLLYGSGEEKIDLHIHPMHRPSHIKHQAFEGIIPNMQRRYQHSDSESVREDLAKYLSYRPCPQCEGSRLNLAARHVTIEDKSLPQLVQWSIDHLHDFFQTLQLKGARQTIAEKITLEITARLKFLTEVGLNYLTLNRSADTLSGGEAQRIRLASQIGSGLVGVMYVLDEPSIGLHQRDNERLLKTLKHLRDLGNTVIVVEHDEDAIVNAVHVIVMGPGAGTHGGRVVAQGTPEEVQSHPDSLTGAYLSKRRSIPVPNPRTPVRLDEQLVLTGVNCHNLQNLSVAFPIGLFTCVTGVSGSGKSSLINDTLYPLAANQLNRAQLIPAGTIKNIQGLTYLDKVIDIDQSPIGRTPRSNPATYTGIFTPIRELFSQTPEARARGYQPGRFSFNVRGGRCEACEGDGLIQVAMHFLPDLYVPCDACQGKRYNRETLDILYKGKNIDEVLNLTVEEAATFFSAIPQLSKKCQTLMDVGLGYIKLGQSATTLSGGEAQRIKLAKELSKRATGRTLFILDEPDRKSVV